MVVVIEQEPDAAETREAPASVSRSGSSDAPMAPPQGGNGSDDESFEDALTEEQLREKALKQANALKEEGNKLFRAGQYEDALLQYEAALQIASELPSSVDVCSMCHGNRAVCFLKLNRYKDTVTECTKALELNPSYAKALVRRAEAHEKLENYDEAIADMKKVIDLDPANDQAKTSIRRLEPIAAEKREKMKEEMISKLKEMGNSLLGRFGMSVDNFKAVKDPNTGNDNSIMDGIMGR
ncbi:tetratricopeptide repeat protein 1 [Canna indica]|uniref:Tetratricopeptide repeat protein 1 n=1 Tax=Canna indica TaxID=4628 RepID=A0AAQ3KWF3_9LILI|nr:tetratricopeptide repeat protein 1 [Canna indica]